MSTLSDQAVKLTRILASIISCYCVRMPGMFAYSQCYVHYTGEIIYDGQRKNNRIVGVRYALS